MFKIILKRKPREKDAQIVIRVQSLCSNINCGICPAPMASDVAINELKNFFLGENWSISDATPSISDIVYHIKRKLKFRRIFQNTQYKELDNADDAVADLIEFFLGKDWYVALPLSFEQCTTEAVYQIEYTYNRFRA